MTAVPVCSKNACKEAVGSADLLAGTFLMKD